MDVTQMLMTYLPLIAGIIGYLLKFNTLEQKFNNLESRLAENNVNYQTRHTEAETKFEKLEGKFDNLMTKLNENTIALVELKATISHIINNSKN